MKREFSLKAKVSIYQLIYVPTVTYVPKTSFCNKSRMVNGLRRLSRWPEKRETSLYELGVTMTQIHKQPSSVDYRVVDE